MKPTNETANCDNCGAECPILERESVVFGEKRWCLRCENCGCFHTSDDKIHWVRAWKVKPELIKDGRKKVKYP